MRHDLRDALRSLRRAPAFSLVAIVMLALAIGSATATFSVVDAVLLHGMPYADPSRLRVIYERSDDGNTRLPSFPTFLDWQAQSAAVRDVIEGFAFVRGDAVGVAGSGEPEQRIAAYVTPGFFGLMGARPVLGRSFTRDDENPGAPRVAVISYAFFQDRFAGNAAAVLGARVTIDSMPTTIVGVMPRGFAFPNFGSGGWLPPTFWQPIAVFDATHAALRLRGLHVDSRAVLRLRAGTDSARAATAMRIIQGRLASEYPAEQAHWTFVSLRRLSDELFGRLQPTLLLIGGAIGLVLLLACANVANLLLVRNSVRGRELAVRAALGAGRWRLVRRLLLEAGMIAGVAGVLGIALSVSLVRFVRPFAAQRLPFATDIHFDARTGVFAVAVSALTALLIGALPAVRAERGSLVTRLRAGQASAVDGAAERRVRDALVAVQLALAITVLIGAGLLVQSARRVSSVDLGYDPDGAISFVVTPPGGKYDAPEQAAALYRRILDATRAIPSVELSAAAGGALLPTKLETEDRPSGGAPLFVSYHLVSADYLKILRIPVVQGRGFTDEDMRSPAGVLVTENLAKHLWPNSSAIGKRITVHRSSQARADFGQPITMPVVGVVADYREFGRDQDAPEQVFLPFTVEVWPWMSFVVRASQPAAALRQIENTIKNVEPAIVFRGTPSLIHSRPTTSFSDPRIFVMTLMSGFAATALLLAAIGLYGIVSYGVAQRTREIGVRIAVGATGGRILALVMRQAVSLVLVGVGAGLLVAAAAARVLRALLFQTTTSDPATFVVVPVVLVVVSVAASLVPAYRATRTDPLVAIKGD